MQYPGYTASLVNLLSLILIFLGLCVGVAICFIAWELSSGFWDPTHREEPGASKESKDPPGSPGS